MCNYNHAYSSLAIVLREEQLLVVVVGEVFLFASYQEQLASRCLFAPCVAFVNEYGRRVIPFLNSITSKGTQDTHVQRTYIQ